MAVIALDVGGTKIKAALLDNQLQIRKSIKVPTRKQKGKTYVLSTIEFLISNFLLGNPKITGIGIALPGIIAPNGKQLFAGETLHFLVGVNLKKRLEKKFRVPVTLANDATCFTLAESIFGSYSTTEKIIGVIWGSGLGASLVEKKGNKQIVSSNPLEIGQVLVVHPKTQKNVKLETLVGGTYLLKTYNTEISKLSKISKKAITVADIYHAKNKEARQLISIAIEQLGKMLGTLTTLCKPDMIILGGGVAQLPKPVYVRLEKVMKKNSLTICSKKTRLQRYSISDDAGLLGAALLAQKKFFRK